MTAEDYREALERLGLTQTRLGRLLALDKATPNRWALGHARVPRAVALLLGLMLEERITIEDLEASPIP